MNVRVPPGRGSRRHPHQHRPSPTVVTPDHRPVNHLVIGDHFHPNKEHAMRSIEFIGVRGGHGTTTVALAAAATLATRGPTRITTPDRRSLCAAVGIAHDGLPIPLAANLELADSDDGDVIDAGTLEAHRIDGPSPDRVASEVASERLRVGVLRGPDYLGLRTLCEHAEAHLDGLVVVIEAGRALDARDVEHVTGRSVVAVVDHTPVIARSIDAGLFLQRVARLREFAQLRTWITQIAVEEAPCAAVS